MVEHPTGEAAGIDIEAGTDAGSDELERFCDQAMRLQRASDRPLQRLRMQHGETVLEARWAAPEARPVVGAAVAVPPGDDAPVAGNRAHLVADTPDPAGDETGPEPGTPVLAPMLGVFYRCPEPGADAFVEPGDLVHEGQQVAIVEAMKLLNPVEAPCPGRVREVLVDDATPVEFGQALLVVEPVPA